MRILQVVTYISPDGAYGGPVRVAINQAKTLTEMGHEVVIAAAAGGFDGPLPNEYDGFPVHLFRAHRLVPKSGFAGLISPGLLRWLVHEVRAADVVHVHLARDLVTLPAAAIALLRGKRLVAQTHGMVDHTEKGLAKPLDLIFTRPILRLARTVFYLTEREREDLTGVAGEKLMLTHLPNGVTVPNLMAVEQIIGPQSEPEVLYLARLHVRKRPMQVVHAALELEDEFPMAKFALVGPDEGEGNVVTAAVRAGDDRGKREWSGPVPPDQTLHRMESASIFVLPSIHEPFPMSVLEAMSVGLPVVVTESCGLAILVKQYGAGVVCGHEQHEFTAAVRQLLKNPDLRITMGARGRNAIETDYSMRNVGKILLKAYDKVTHL